MCDLLSVIKNGSWNSGESAYLSKGKNTKIPLGTGHYFWPGVGVKNGRASKIFSSARRVCVEKNFPQKVI